MSGGRFGWHRCEKTLAERAGEVRPESASRAGNQAREPRRRRRARAGARYARNRVPPHGPAGGGGNGKEANGMRWNGGMREAGRQGPGEGGGERGGAGGRMTKHDIS